MTTSSKSNTANGNGGGIQIMLGSNSNTIRYNVANRSTVDGLTIYMSDGNTFTDNTVNSNGKFGFVLFGGSSFNTLTGNVGRNNGSFDAYDEGSGTGNVWTSNNFGTTSGI